MALDVGNKWIGVAISDESRTLASPLDPVRYESPTAALAALEKLSEAWHATQIVVGLPLNLNGSEGPQAAKVKALAEQLPDDVPVSFWDERLSTVAAERLLIQQGVRRERRKPVVDGLAATLILQGYLDSLKLQENVRGDNMADDKDLQTGFQEEEDEVVVLTDEDGQEHEFVVVDVIEVESKEYAILLPIDTSDDEEAEAVILRLEKDADGEEILVDIDSDEEWEKVAGAYEELLDQEEPDHQ